MKQNVLSSCLLIVLLLMVQTQVWTQTLKKGPVSHVPEGEISMDRNPGGIGSPVDNLGNDPGIPPPFDDQDDGPGVPDRHVPEDFQQGGIGYEQEIKAQDRPGILSIHRRGNAEIDESLEELLQELVNESIHVKANIDEKNGLVRYLKIKSKPENPCAKVNGNPFQRANAFLHRYKHLFLPSGRTVRESTFSILEKSKKRGRDHVGKSHIKYQQKVGSIEVYGAQISVHMDDSGITSINGKTAIIPDDLSLTPSIDAQQARSIIESWADQKFNVSSLRVSEPVLKVFDPELLLETEVRETHLAWHFNVTNSGGGIYELIWLDAHSGEVVLHYSNVQHAN